MKRLSDLEQMDKPGSGREDGEENVEFIEEMRKKYLLTGS